ncbi:hypothetical protein GCK32_017388, partial [Trichostrongylus colubriformis]
MRKRSSCKKLADLLAVQVPCQKCKKVIPVGTPFFEVDHAPKCTDCCINDGTKTSPKTAPRPVSCQKCKKDIPAGTPFCEVDHAPKCSSCCIDDGTKPSPITAAGP